MFKGALRLGQDVCFPSRTHSTVSLVMEGPIPSALLTQALLLSVEGGPDQKLTGGCVY